MELTYEQIKPYIAIVALVGFALGIAVPLYLGFRKNEKETKENRFKESSLESISKENSNKKRNGEYNRES